MRPAFVISVVVLAGTSLSAQYSLNVQHLGNWNERPSPSGVYSPYSACWGYTAPDGREYALLGSTLGTSVIDITDAPTLTEVAFIPGPFSNWREMKVYQQYACIVSDQNDGVTPNGVQIVDLSNPDSAWLVTTYVWQDTTDTVITSVPRAHTISNEGAYLYLNGGPYNGIRILDLTNPVAPQQAGKYVGPYVHDSFVRNDTVYAAAIYGIGIDIVDARDKRNPTRIKLINYPGAGTHNTWTTTDGSYVLSTDEINSTPKTLKIWNIRDLNNPSLSAEVAVVNDSDTAIVHNVVVRENLAYVAWYTAGVRIIDVRDPAMPVVVGAYDTYPSDDLPAYAGAWGVYPFFPSGKFIVSDMQTGLHVLQFTGGSVSVPSRGIPSGYTLHQNYPNPFNPSTTISFELPVRDNVSLTIHSLDGRQLATVVRGELPPGLSTFSFVPNGFSSGMYLYRLHGSFGSITRSMILLK